MICYWYRGCHGRDVTGYEALKFLIVSTTAELGVFRNEEQFRAFECEHKPTRIRMLTFNDKIEPIYGEWHESL